MKEIIIDSKRQAELLGVLFAEYEILTTEQISLVKQQMEKPSYFYNGDVNSLWSFYNHVTFALKKSHPRNWMEDQRKLHWFLSMEFDLMNFQTVEDIEEEVIDQLLNNYGQPENQTNILHQLMELDDLPFPIYIESDSEYVERVAQIEGELEIIDLDDEEDEDWNKLESLGIITPYVSHDPEEIIQYIDPAGNTFEAPVVKTTTLEPTPEEYLLIEAEINQEIIEEESLFDVSKLEITSDKGFDWDLSLDIKDEEEKNTDNYFL